MALTSSFLRGSVTPLSNRMNRIILRLLQQRGPILTRPSMILNHLKIPLSHGLRDLMQINRQLPH